MSRKRSDSPPGPEPRGSAGSPDVNPAGAGAERIAPFQFNSGFSDDDGITAFAPLQDEFENAATAAFSELLGDRKPFDAWDMCDAFLYVETGFVADTAKTYGVTRVRLFKRALDAGLRIRHSDWSGKTRSQQRHLFQSLMAELGEKYAAWARKKGYAAEALLLRDGFALAIEKFKSRRYATPTRRALPPYAPWTGSDGAPTPTTAPPATPKAKVRQAKTPAKAKPRKTSPPSRK